MSISAVFIILFTFIVCFSMFWHVEHWQTIDAPNYFSQYIGGDNTQYNSELQIKENEKYFILSGFSYKVNERVQNFDISIALKEIDNNSYTIVPTHLVNRHDLSVKAGVPEKRGSFAMYDASGFETRIRKNKLEYGKQYKVYIVNKNNAGDVLIDTGKFIDYE